MRLPRLESRDVKNLRATFSALKEAIHQRIARVFLSANYLNIPVFRAIEDHDTFRHGVNGIVWDDAGVSRGLELKEDRFNYINENPGDTVADNGCPLWFKKGRQSPPSIWMALMVAMLPNVLGGKEVKQVANFVKDTFGEAGMDLVKAVSILSDVTPEDITDSVGRDVLGLGGSVDVLGVLGDFYGSEKAMKLVGSMFGDLLDHGGPVSTGPMDISGRLWDVFRPPSFSIDPFKPFGIQSEPDNQILRHIREIKP